MTVRCRGRRLVARLERLEKYLTGAHPEGILIYWVDEDGTESDHIFVPPPAKKRTRRRVEGEED